MKTSQTIKYILLALIVLGCFANFAQNEYGLLIAKLALAGLILAFIFDTVYFLRKEKLLIPGESQNKKLILSLIIVTILSFVLTVVLSISSEYQEEISVPPAIIFLISFSILIIYLSNRPLFIESLLFILYSTGIFFKLNHWPLAGVIISLSTILLLSYFISGIYIYFKTEKKQNITAAWFLLIVFLIIILNLTGSLFKIQHWPLSNTMGYLATLLWLFILACLVLNRQFNYPGRKISLWTLIGKIRGNFTLIFIFYSIATIYFVLSQFNIVPGFYSNARPYALNILQENSGTDEGRDKYYYYSDSYYDFLKHRKENKDTNK